MKTKSIQSLKRYGVRGSILLFRYLIYTKLFYSQARVVRFPFYIRGKKHINLGTNLTTGVGCRIETIPLNFNNKNYIIEIGDNVQINDYVHIAGVNKIRIGNNVLIASKVFISDHNHGSYSCENIGSNPLVPPIERVLDFKSVTIEDNVWIGESVSVLQGVIIGKGSIIGANSVVNSNIPPFCIAVGTPAKVIKIYNFKTNSWESKK